MYFYASTEMVRNCNSYNDVFIIFYSGAALHEVHIP